MSTPWIIAFATLWLLVIVLGLVVLGALRRLDFWFSEAQKALDAATAQLRSDGLQSGEIVGAFSATTVDGAPFARDDLLEEPSIVLFVSSDCAACALLLSGLERGDRPESSERFVVVTDNNADAERVSTAGAKVVIQQAASVAQAFKSHRTPHLFVLDGNGHVVANGSPNTWEDMADLVNASGKGGVTHMHEAAAVPSSV
jgi:hypothetical protein